MIRLDTYLVDNKLIESRTKAQREIQEGKVFVNGKCITKSSYRVEQGDSVEVKGNTLKYISRAGLKLEKAQKEFNIDFSDKIVLDIGSSTGGFTDFCLKNGAKKVYAVDVGTNQLHQSLRENNKVICMEQTDIRNIKKEELECLDIIVCDVSFISLELICHKISELLEREKTAVVLIKPQFECGKKICDKYKGVIKDNKIHNMCIDNIKKCFSLCNMLCLGVKDSPILGGDGNKEFLAFFVKI